MHISKLIPCGQLCLHSSYTNFIHSKGSEWIILRSQTIDSIPFETSHNSVVFAAEVSAIHPRAICLLRFYRLLIVVRYQ